MTMSKSVQVFCFVAVGCALVWGVDQQGPGDHKSQLFQVLKAHGFKSGYTQTDIARILQNFPELAKLSNEVMTDSPMMKTVMEEVSGKSAVFRLALDAVKGKSPNLQDIVEAVMKPTGEPLRMLSRAMETFISTKIRPKTGTFESSLRSIMGDYDINSGSKQLQPDYTNDKYIVSSHGLSRKDVTDVANLVHFALANSASLLDFYQVLKNDHIDIPVLADDVMKLDFSVYDTSKVGYTDQELQKTRQDLETLLENSTAGLKSNVPVTLNFYKLLAIARSGFVPTIAKIAKIIHIVAGV